MDLSLARLLALLRRETTQLLRDRRLLAFVLGIPVLELVLYGYAAHLTVYHLPVAVVDQSRDRKSREFVGALVNSGYFDAALYVASQAEAQRAIDRGAARAAVIIPPRFASLMDEGQADVLILLDGTDSAGVQSGYSAAVLIAQNYAVHVTGQTEAGAGALPITASTQVLYNPDLIDIWFILPGLAGLILQTLAVQQAALIVVRDRELGTIEQVLASPTRPLELMISKIIPLLVLCLAAVGIVVGLGVFWFHVPFQGSFGLYLWLALLFIASSLGLGLFLSTRANTQMEASQLSLVFMMFGILLSGFMYPVNTMPALLRLIGALFPVTYFIRISRAIFLKGVGLSFVWSDALVLAVYAVVIVVVAARSFKARLD